jgi:hypothetical protein
MILLGEFLLSDFHFEFSLFKFRHVQLVFLLPLGNILKQMQNSLLSVLKLNLNFFHFELSLLQGGLQLTYKAVFLLKFDFELLNMCLMEFSELF